jgi:hypothetical protein
MAKTYGSTFAHLHIGRVRRGLADCVSVKEGKAPVYYSVGMVMADVVFCVREAGRQQTLRENVKNVHAWVTGEVMDGDADAPCYSDAFIADPETDWVEVKYNPTRPTFFLAATGEPVHRASYVRMTGTKVFALDPS